MAALFFLFLVFIVVVFGQTQRTEKGARQDDMGFRRRTFDSKGIEGRERQ